MDEWIRTWSRSWNRAQTHRIRRTLDRSTEQSKLDGSLSCLNRLLTSRNHPGLRAQIRRVAILFAGGPAPAANAVISTAASSFRRHGIEVLGIMHGYAQLVEYGEGHPMQEGRDYIVLDQTKLRRTRNTRGILIGTSRVNPGKEVSQPSHLADPSAPPCWPGCIGP